MSGNAETRWAAQVLAEMFPGVQAWYGEATGEWWAMISLPTGDRLLSAPDVHQLREQITLTKAWPWRQT